MVPYRISINFGQKNPLVKLEGKNNNTKKI